MSKADKIIGKLIAHIDRSGLRSYRDIYLDIIYSKQLIELARQVSQQYCDENPEYLELLEQAEQMQLPYVCNTNTARDATYHQIGIWDNLRRRAQFCRQLTERREQIRWCRSITASRCYMKESNYRRIEEGKYSMTLDTLLDIASVIGCEVRLIPKDGWTD